MRIHNLFADKDGESHFRDIEIEWEQIAPMIENSKRIPAKGLYFVRTQSSYDLDWHNAPRRQYIINLDTGIRITASDGESREILPGDVLLVEDTSGKGHLSESISGQIRHAVFIPLE